jgi:hypothetical protein
MLSLVSGLAAGMTHALTGADHIAAVAPLAFRSGKLPWTAGLRWGLGHSAGVALVGVVFLAFRKVVPIDPVAAFSERLVGVTLIGVGAWALRAALRVQIHTHTHSHGRDPNPHTHVHVHADHHSHSTDSNTTRSSPVHYHGHAAFGVGTLHGLAGSSHLLGVLPALALPTFLDSGLYLAGFGGGTIAAMAGFSAILGCFAGRLSRASSALYYRWTLGSMACLTGAVGIYWLACA